jgi:hypothetical protein
MIGYSNNSGRSLLDAIVIAGATSHREGVEAEYQYLARLFPGYRVNRQALKNQSGRFYDEMDIELADGTSTKIYFDITEPYTLLMNEFKPR